MLTCHSPRPSTTGTSTSPKTDNKDSGKSDSILPTKGLGLGGGEKGPLSLGKDAAEDVAGSLKIHIKLALEIDIQIMARIKGDIAIGIL